MIEPARPVKAASPYNYRWQQARKGFLRKHPLCARCQRQGIVEPACIVDHIIPHRGDMTLFWDRSNWQSLCGPCHNSYKQRLEKSGREIGCDQGGKPLDPGHHWNR
ncbi:HNH endonuclease signature motif containing protein [uncultured Pseudomonas sp.]|uniref:HNH endonuclease n=1 Tax=uncultured Pseudomonas sp. TaxID=114707 RepID=UPI00259644AC|nr:HNH endonuclease signature motif containing protein [uncultured Pseudomonas sp.]